MPTKQEGLQERSDGRLYSRILRRCVALLKHINPSRKFDLIEMAREVQEQGYPEFHTRRENQLTQIRADRIRDYLSYLVDLQVIQASEKQYCLNFKKPATDGHWAQVLSDIAREHLARILVIPIATLQTHLEGICKKLHAEHRVPTVASLIAEVEVESARREEVFRWSLYLFADGDACPFEIRKYPHIVLKAERRINNV